MFIELHLWGPLFWPSSRVLCTATYQPYLAPPEFDDVSYLSFREGAPRLVVGHVGHQPRERSLLRELLQRLDAKICK